MPAETGRRKRVAGSGNAAAMMGSDTASSTAPPIPWTARIPMRTSALGDIAHPNDAAVNSTMPDRYSGRRPSRSPSVAAVSSSAAMGSA